jgi:hypothetical protein
MGITWLKSHAHDILASIGIIVSKVKREIEKNQRHFFTTKILNTSIRFVEKAPA